LEKEKRKSKDKIKRKKLIKKNTVLIF